MNVKSSGNMGDLLATIPAMRQIAATSKEPVTLYIWLNRKAFYYDGAVHPVTHNGDMVMFNQYMFDMAYPFLMAQDCIGDVKVWDGEKIDVDFDKIREQFINMPFGDLRRWVFYIYPQLACDLTKKYMQLPTEREPSGKIIVNRTERYLNPMISCHFLRDYENVWFSGTEKEHGIFCKEFNLDIPRIVAKDFLELATEIQNCKLYIGCQSMSFQIAEGLKVPRVVELCSAAPNVIPCGEYAYDFYAQVALEYYVKLLHGR